MTLDEYVRVEMRRRWLWGKCDCVHFGLGWARERTGRDLTAFFDYGSRDQAIAALSLRKGLERIVRQWMEENRFSPTDEPDDGDIGLAPTPTSAAGAVAPVAVVIRRGPWWLTREPRGVGSIRFEAIPAWRIC